MFAKLMVAAAPLLLALVACAEGGRGQALDAFVAAQDEARDELRLFQDEAHRTCGSGHLAKASAGADGNLALLAAGGPTESSVVRSVETRYGDGPIDDIASLTLEVANEAAEAGCADQARALYRYVLDRYLRSDYADFRQRAEAGLAEIEGR